MDRDLTGAAKAELHHGEKVRAERERLQKEAAADQIRKAQQAKRLKADFVRVCKTESGRNIFRYIMEICGHNEPSLVQSVSTGDILANVTINNEARRGVYLDIRRQFPKKQLIQIEMNPREGDDEDADED